MDESSLLMRAWKLPLATVDTTGTSSKPISAVLSVFSPAATPPPCATTNVPAPSRPIRLHTTHIRFIVSSSWKNVACSPQQATEEFQRAAPRVLRGGRVVHLWPRVIEERMLRVRIGMKLVRLAERGQLAVELRHDLRRDETVLARPQPEHRRLQGRQVGRHVRMPAVEDDARSDFRVLRRRKERQRSAHAE